MINEKTPKHGTSKLLKYTWHIHIYISTYVYICSCVYIHKLRDASEILLSSRFCVAGTQKFADRVF